MTEQEWLACTDSLPMLNFLRGQASDRKLRLLACASCRSIWHLLTDPRGRNAVEISERFADGDASTRELTKARKQAQNAWTAINDSQPQAFELSDDAGEAGSMLITAIDAAQNSADKDTFVAARSSNICAAHTVGKQAAILAASPLYNDMDAYVREELAGRQKQYAHQSQLLLDIFGNPFHPITIDRHWLAWNGGSVPKIAQAIYEERAFDRLPILGDALEEAGCDNADILNHCRQPGVHVRGCWVLDLILGKE
jgi:hypothetical protein